MDTLQLLSIITVIFFGAVSIVISLKEEKLKKELGKLKTEKENLPNTQQSNPNQPSKSILSMQEEPVHLIVHELRAPLSIIKNAAELLIKDQNTSSEEKANFISLIDRQAKKMLEQIATILDAAKLKAGKFGIEKKPADLKKTISETVVAFVPQTKTKNISLTLNIDPDLPSVNFDQMRIEEVINNLLSNSLKFTPGNGKIEINATVKGAPLGYVAISIKDTGIGIAKEKQQNIFSKFSQSRNADNGTEPHDFTIQEGSGLGLYIVKGIIEAHGGAIFLESEENKGTNISFTLPIT